MKNGQHKSNGASGAASPGDMPLVSVVIPVYNALPYLRQCLESVVGQEYSNLEIILLNDGSTDDSLSVLRGFEEQDGRITVIDKPNQGYGATCNRGISEAHGEWVSVVEPDDWIESGMYAEMIAFALGFDEKGTPLDIVKTPYWRICNPDTPHQQKLHCSYHNRIHPDRQPFTIERGIHLLKHHPSIWSALYRRSFLEQNAIRFPEYPGAGWADNPFMAATLCAAKAIGYLDEPFYCYREDTVEEAAAFAGANPLLPMQRWNDTLDVMEHLHVFDAIVLQAHYERGFTNLATVLGAAGFDREDVHVEAGRMFNRMDSGLVFPDSEISPAMKRLFAEERGLAYPRLCVIPYAISLIREGLYSVRNNGLAVTLKAMSGVSGR